MIAESGRLPIQPAWCVGSVQKTCSTCRLSVITIGKVVLLIQEEVGLQALTDSHLNQLIGQGYLVIEKVFDEDISEKGDRRDGKASQALDRG